MDSLFDMLFLVIAAVFIFTGFVGIPGKDSNVLAGKGGGLKLAAGGDARLFGFTYLALGVILLGATRGWWFQAPPTVELKPPATRAARPSAFRQAIK